MSNRENTDKLINIKEVKEAAAARAQKFKEDIQASRKSSETDDPFDVFVYDPIAIRLTGMFIKMKWTPNAVTLLSLVFGVAGAVLLYPKRKIIIELSFTSCWFCNERTP